MSQKINIVLFGIGNAGSAFINKILKSRKSLLIDKGINLQVPVIASSAIAFYAKEGANLSWEANFIQFGMPYRIEDVVACLQGNKMANLVAIDATGDAAFLHNYAGLLKSGFNVVSVNHAVQNVHLQVSREMAITALNRGLGYTYLSLPRDNKDAAADAMLNAVLSFAAKEKEVA